MVTGVVIWFQAVYTGFSPFNVSHCLRWGGGGYHICRKWTSVEELLLYSLWAMPVPAEVYWTSPRFSVSTLFIESR
jgi:hypothetical protein